jgi:tight adherence protein C
MSHPLLFALFTFLTLMVAMTGVAYRLFYKPGRMLKQLGAPVITADPGGGVIAPQEQHGFTIVTMLTSIGAKVPSSQAELATLRANLMRAGFRSEKALPVFHAVRILSTLIFMLVSLALQAKMPPNPSLSVLLIVFGCAAGWVFPRSFVEKKVKKRQHILRLSLPDALDLMVVSIEAGLGLDQAIQHVSRELQVSNPELSEELSLVILEMRAGKRRQDALRNFGERTGESEIRKLVAILVQNDRFGTSMGESLRTHSDYLRTRRRQDAEERAAKVGVKLVFPIFFFILPSMLIVAAGPGLLQVFKYLFPMMKTMGQQ